MASDKQTATILPFTARLRGVELPRSVQFTGFHFEAKTSAEFAHMIGNFFRVTCPCGVHAFFPLNAVPTETTPHPCGDPGHFSVSVKVGHP